MSIKRMFSNQIIDTDAFLDLPITAQCLYFHLGMRSDDDGFISNASRIVKSIGCTNKDLQILLDSGYLILFPKRRVYVITDFKINNTIRCDRYRPTLYQEEFRQLTIDKNQRYTIGIPNDNQMTTKPQPDQNDTKPQESNNFNALNSGTPNDNQLTTKPTPSIDNYSIDEDIIDIAVSSGGKTKSKRFSPPSIEEISQYCRERKNGIDAERFFDYYETRGWELKPGMKVKDWKACVRTWEKNQKGGNYGLSGTRTEDRVPGQRDDYEF